MKKRRGTVAERIRSLEIAYGSQKALAKSLGVSTRTIRRWKNRDRGSEGLRAWSEKAVARRERYRYVQKFKGAIPQIRDSGELVLSDHIRPEFYASIAAELPDRYPDLFREIMRERPDIVVTIAHRPGLKGGTIVNAPSRDELDRLRSQGYTIEQRYISGDSYKNWESLSSALWDMFRDVYQPGR